MQHEPAASGGSKAHGTPWAFLIALLLLVDMSLIVMLNNCFMALLWLASIITVAKTCRDRFQVLD